MFHRNPKIGKSLDGENIMASYKVVIERDKCTSCGNCEEECSEFFELDSSDGLSHLLGSKKIDDNDELEVEDPDCCLDAALSCPVICIHVYDEDGEEMT